MFNVIDTDTSETVYTAATFAEALALRDGCNAGVEGAAKYPRYTVGRA